MDVHLLVYDLSRGLARQMSAGLLGFQLDAIYHTSIKLRGREYVYDGGIVSIVPGSSHLGQPMEEILLGRTELPMDVIEEYLDSLREIYTVEAYDLWRHNCNNFSNDFATFLVGKGIPSHISNMPQAVLDSPFGQMLMPMLDQQINASRRAGGILGIEDTPGSSVKPKSDLHHHEGKVQHITNLSQLEQVLNKFNHACAVVFFTSATCPPCKMLYPLYDQLAAEVGDKGVLIKVDVSHARDVGMRYQISATPTFITFLKGKQEERWSGADQARLRGTTQLLVQMAFPPHPHQALNLPTISNPSTKPVLFTKIPPLPKLLAKLGPTASDPAIQSLSSFISTRSTSGPASTPVPSLTPFTTLLLTSLTALPADTLFPLVDLLRLALIDPRVSGLLAEEPAHKTITTLLTHVNALSAKSTLPYALRLVTLHLACNLFSSPLYADQILLVPPLRTAITTLVSSSFLDDSHANVRVAAASLLFNLSLANSAKRIDGPGDALPQEDQVELAASVLEAITQEQGSTEALEGMLRALGHLVYRTDIDSELVALLRTMDAADTVLAKGKVAAFKGMGLIKEVGGELLEKGLRKP